MNFISIALPVYNGEDYLAEALESISSQDYTNYELVVSENNSSDRTNEILKAYAEKNPRIKIYKSDTTIGQVDNVNRAFSLCKSEWVQFFCHDDIMLPGTLSYLNEVIELYKNSNVALIGHGPSWLFKNGVFDNPYFKTKGQNYRQWDEVKKSDFKVLFKKEELKYYKNRVSIEQMLEGNALYLPALTTALVNKDRFNQIGGFDKKYIHFDVFAWMRLLMNFDYILINQSLTITRIHGAQVAVGARKSLRTIEDNKVFWKSFYREYNGIINFDIKKKAFIFLKPISISASLVGVELVKGNYKNAFSTFIKLPLHWHPFVSAFLLKNYPREKNRTKELNKYVPLQEIYP